MVYVARCAAAPLLLLLRHAVPLARAPPVLCVDSDRPANAGGLVPVVDAALVDAVKGDLWRTASADPSIDLRGEQTQAMATVLGRLVRVVDEAEAAAAASGRKRPEGSQPALSQQALDAAIAPQLPLLMLRGFTAMVREALTEVSTPSQLRAVQELNNYMVGVYGQMGDALGDLEWKQQQKLRELCEAAMEGGTEALLETAEAMRADLDADFCNYLNYAIEQEELRLSGLGVAIVGGPMSPALKGGPAQAALRGSAPSALPQPAAPASGRGSGASGEAVRSDGLEPSDEERASAELPEQRWLLALRLVRQGTYSMLAKEYDSDVKQIRYIMALLTPEARRELTVRSMIEMSEVRETRRDAREAHAAARQQPGSPAARQHPGQPGSSPALFIPTTPEVARAPARPRPPLQLRPKHRDVQGRPARAPPASGGPASLRGDRGAHLRQPLCAAQRAGR